jgi:hypothetical protein
MACRQQAKTLLPIGEHRGENCSRMRNSTSIVNLAEDLRLYPSKIYSNEDNANLSLMRLMATD